MEKSLTDCVKAQSCGKGLPGCARGQRSCGKALPDCQRSVIWDCFQMLGDKGHGKAVRGQGHQNHGERLSSLRGHVGNLFLTMSKAKVILESLQENLHVVLDQNLVLQTSPV